MDQVMVSVGMITYNHEAYIAQAIESILMQKCSFPYEIVIGEDRSTDQTREIVCGYQKRYPDRIKLILHDKNVGMIKNSNEVIRQLTGQYVAYLDGDDFWTDAYKLEKQVRFLKQHEEYIGVAHNVKIIDQNNRTKNNQPFPIGDERVFSIHEYGKRRLVGHGSTVLHKNVFHGLSKRKQHLYFNCKANPDEKMTLLLLLNGDVFFMKDAMSTYRCIRKGGTGWSAYAYGNNLYHHEYLTCEELEKLAFSYDGTVLDLLETKGRCFVQSVRWWFNQPNKKNAQIAYRIFHESKHKRSLLYWFFRECMEHAFMKQKY